MRKKRNKTKVILILLLLAVLLASIGFATYSTTLTIKSSLGHIAESSNLNTDTQAHKTIINVPIDSRPISRSNFSDLVKAAGYNYVEVQVGLDNMVKSSDTQGKYVKGDHTAVWSELEDALNYGRYNTENSTVIVNLSSYFFDGLISTRDWIAYEDMEKKISELEQILKTYNKPTYYVIMQIPRVRPEFRIIEYPSGVNSNTKITTPIDFTLGTNIIRRNKYNII